MIEKNKWMPSVDLIEKNIDFWKNIFRKIEVKDNVVAIMFQAFFKYKEKENNERELGKTFLETEDVFYSIIS